MLANLAALMLAVIFLIPLAASATFFAEIAACLFLPRARRLPLVPIRPVTGILVPAHNEEAGISALIGHLRPQLAHGDILLVVADNCSDRTAELAAQAGAKVLVRTNAAQKGKGYALAAGMAQLAEAPPDAVVFLDADIRLSDQGVQCLARACLAASAPVQCLNLMLAAPGPSQCSRLGEFAWRIRNDLRPTGLARLGAPCQLLGTGMALPWQLAQQLTFATGHVTEDLKIGLECAALGHAPVFFDEVSVSSYFPQTPAGRTQQKQRWMHGQMTLMGTVVPKLAWQSLRRGNRALLALALDLMVPPLGILAFVNVLAMLAGFALAVLASMLLPLFLALAGGMLFCLAVLGAWHLRGRTLIGPRELLDLAGHLWRVLRIGALFAWGKRSLWVRADRSA